MGICLHVAARTDAGRVRNENEDAFLTADFTRGEILSNLPVYRGRVDVGDRGALVALSDGVRGATAGDVASALVLSSLAKALTESDVASESPRQAVVGAVEQAHRAVWRRACGQGIEMGATLAAAYVLGEFAYVAEVGDSRAYLLRSGKFTQLTKDQSYVRMLLDGGAVTEGEAKTLPRRHVVLQAMGIQPSVSVAIGRLELRDRDCLLLCSDGLTSTLEDDEIRAAILESPTLENAAERLVAIANDRGGEDNITAVLVGVGGGLPTSQPCASTGQTCRILETFEPYEAPRQEGGGTARVT